MSVPYIIDNNNFKDRKSLSLFKRFPFVNGVYNKKMENIVRINNVKEGRVFYSLVDTPHSVYNGEISLPGVKGLILRKYKKDQSSPYETSNLLSKIERQTTVKKIIGSFESEEPIDVEIEVQFDSGYMRALLDIIQRGEIITPFICICSCGGGSPPPPPTYYTSIFEYMDIIVEYNNITATTDKVFYQFQTEYNEFKEGHGLFTYKKEHEFLNDKNYSRIAFGLNSNFAVDFSHYDTEWIPDGDEGEFGKEPCQRIHVVGNLNKSTVEEIWDKSEGELFEEPDKLEQLTEKNYTNSQVFLEIDATKVVNQIAQIYSQKICEVQPDDDTDFLIYNIYVRKDETKIYIIEEFSIKLGNEEWFNNDRLRFKSNSSIGFLFMV